jgi:hypothetical protein
VPQSLIPTEDELAAEAEAAQAAREETLMAQSPVVAQVAGALAQGAARQPSAAAGGAP